MIHGLGSDGRFDLDGRSVEFRDEDASLLDVLRDELGVRSVKDGCSPQGQCGCCTVLVDGQPRVACVTPVRRVAGRSVTTIQGLSEAERSRWVEAFTSTGASQCGFCTPGIVMRLCALASGEGGRQSAGIPEVQRALQAHLCRCTGWQPILDAWRYARSPGASARDHDPAAAALRATIEGGSPQVVGNHVVLGGAGFADDVAPPGALVALPDVEGGWVVAETCAEARRMSGKVQGRRTTGSSSPPLEVPDGDWFRTLRTSWVEPAYLEPDASWCEPGGEPASPLANGGAFGGKRDSEVMEVARRLADEHGRPVRVLLPREEVVRRGPKRPPLAAGVRADGTGEVRVARTPGVAERLKAVLPGLLVEEVELAGPPTSVEVRAAGWAEAAVLACSMRDGPIDRVEHSSGAWAEACLDGDGTVHVTVRCGEVLDEVVVRSYATGAAHMALGWVTSEGLTVDADGRVGDLTIRSFGILRATDMPAVEVEVVRDDGPPVRGSDVVFAAVAAATWRHQGYPEAWPTGLAVRGSAP